MYYVDYEDSVFLKQKLTTGKVNLDEINGKIWIDYDLDFKVTLVNTAKNEKSYIDLSDLILFCKANCVVNFTYLDSIKKYIIFFLNRFVISFDVVDGLYPSKFNLLNDTYGYDSYYYYDGYIHYKDSKLCTAVLPNGITYDFYGLSRSGRSVVFCKKCFRESGNLYSLDIHLYTDGKFVNMFSVTSRRNSDGNMIIASTSKDIINDIEKYLMEN